MRFALLVLACLTLAGSQTASAQVSIAPLGGFRTPSGNIHCEEWQIDAPRKTELRCDVIESNVPRKRRPLSCELDYGFAFMLSSHRRAWMLCAGDTVADPAHTVLPYGETWRGTGITCETSAARLRCVNTDGHGFELSRRGQRTF